MIRRCRRRPRSIAGLGFYGLLALFAGIGVVAGPIAFVLAISASVALVVSEGIHHVIR